MNTQFFTPMIKAIITLAIVTALSACGGGGSNDSGNDTGNEIPADFDLFSQTGTWRLGVDTRIDNIEVSFIFDDQQINFSTDLDLDILTVGSLEDSGSQVVSDTCGVEPAEILDKEEFTGSAITDMTEIVDDLELGCQVSTTYTKLSDTSYLISASCGADFSMDMSFDKISNAASLDFGGISFTSTDYDDLSSTSGACGTIIDSVADTTVTPQPNTMNEPDRTDSTTIVEVAAPYGSNRIAFEFTLSSNPLMTGTYTVVAGIANPNEAEVYIGSVLFGGTVDDPLYAEVQNGTVTVTSVTQYGVIGSFDLNTQFNGSFVGTFNFDMQ